MDTLTAQALARSLIAQHLGHLTSPPVAFRWSRGTRVFGSYSERTALEVSYFIGRVPENIRRVVKHREIALSTALVKVNTPERVRRVILHEIAHALAGIEAGHGPLWRAQCAAVGIAGETQCWSSHDTVTPPARWQTTCPVCARVYKMDRLSPRRRNGSRCRCPAAPPLTWVKASE